MKRIVLGILAHVDAGKTTLSEAMLYESGEIRSLGRVDKKNTLLDNFESERERGITIFAKQAGFVCGDTRVTLLDTPGHVDFAAETERTLQVLDYCILVVSGVDGVQGHTRTLWKLLSQYKIPTIIFVNKMDQPGTDEEKLLKELQNQLGSGVIPIKNKNFLLDEETCENIAVCDEELMERYLEEGSISLEDVEQLVVKRLLFPCFFGSALKLCGVKELLEGLDYLTMDQDPAEEEFGAKVYKITRDAQGNRLTHLKITGGKLTVRMPVRGMCENRDPVVSDREEESEEEETDKSSGVAQADDSGLWEEKVTQIRVYQGEKYETVGEAEKGMVCAVMGLTKTFPGQGLGNEKNSPNPVLQPVMKYQMIFPGDVDAKKMYPQICVLGEEDPALHVLWNEKNRGIEVKLMGEVQTEILRDIVKQRFGVNVTFGEGKISYRETIRNVVEGVGHFEPLRHYAEVHLLLEPGEPGSGLCFETDVSEDVLSLNWQRLILTHLAEKEHRGVLTGSPITDMKITLINGKAHLKHTEGGDFRKATYRAVRHGLMKAESELLEPYYEFHIEVPTENLGRALSDLDRMKARFEAPFVKEEVSEITGIAPVSLMNGYQKDLIAYTKGRGSISFEFFGYRPCHNTEEVVACIGYEPTADVRNPVSSVFCAHGAGFVVDWTDVESYMHLENGGWRNNKAADNKALQDPVGVVRPKTADIHHRYREISYSDDKELQDIFRRTYGESKRGKQQDAVVYGTAPVKEKRTINPVVRKEYLLVDGYNVIHANKELEELMQANLESARNVLMDVLSNYQGFRNKHVILVFDAYRVKGNPGEIFRYHNIDVVFTREAETADRYIERTAHEISHDYNTTVVTSDGLEQVIIRGAGCRLMSSREFWEDVEICRKQIGDVILERRKEEGKQGNYLFGYADEDLAEHLEQIRLGEKEKNNEKLTKYDKKSV
ncbi:MAG: NYN domain-containing protein [Lachnospiraceae bacterium]